MAEPPPANITGILDRIRKGDEGASAALMDIVYEELRRMAGAIHASGQNGLTLQPTALVHEVWLKLDGRLDAMEGRTHFYAVAAKAMRHVLADHAKAMRREKRGGDRRRVTLVEGEIQSPLAEVDPVDLDDSLLRLAELDARQARVVEYRLFGGMTQSEIAEIEGVTRRTIDTDWSMARAWLTRELFDL